MTRTAAFLAVMLALVAVLVAICGSSAHTPLAYTPLTSGFQTLGVPVDAGRESPRAWDRVASTPSSSILPSTSQPAPSAPGATNSPKPLYRPRPTATPVVGGIGAAVVTVRGTATWYSRTSGGAAAASRLRGYLGPDWRGMTVRVCGVRCVRLVLDDYESSMIAGRLIDLSPVDFERVCGPLSGGVCQVEVSHG